MKNLKPSTLPSVDSTNGEFLGGQRDDWAVSHSCRGLGSRVQCRRSRRTGLGAHAAQVDGLVIGPIGSAFVTKPKMVVMTLARSRDQHTDLGCVDIDQHHRIRIAFSKCSAQSNSRA